MSLPIMPCSVAHLPPKGAYSIPNSSRCLSRRYSVKVRTFQLSTSLRFQSPAGGSLLVMIFPPYPRIPVPYLPDSAFRNPIHLTYFTITVIGFLKQLSYLID